MRELIVNTTVKYWVVYLETQTRHARKNTGVFTKLYTHKTCSQILWSLEIKQSFMAFFFVVVLFYYFSESWFSSLSLLQCYLWCSCRGESVFHYQGHGWIPSQTPSLEPEKTDHAVANQISLFLKQFLTEACIQILTGWRGFLCVRWLITQERQLAQSTKNSGMVIRAWRKNVFFCHWKWIFFQ